MTKTIKKEKDDVSTWIFILAIIGLLFLIFLELVGQGKPHEQVRLEDKCSTFCQEKGLKMGKIGFIEPCGGHTFDDCLICFCYEKDDIKEQSMPFFMKTGELYTWMVIKK